MHGRGQPWAAEFGVTGGVASDGTNMFVVTGNTFNTGGNWMGRRSYYPFTSRPVFNGHPSSANYWVPPNWLSLDNGDTDLGDVSATVIDVPELRLPSLS